MAESFDPFDQEDFDPIKYINMRFPDESSLNGLDEEIEKIGREVEKLDKEILEDIHEHALLNKKTKAELENSHSLTQGLISEIKSIQQKSLESEAIVQEMCKDIKTLDLAKRNITLSINCLRKFADLISSLEALKKATQEGSYRTASSILLSINDLATYFKPYEKIQQISEELEEKNSTLRNLRLKLQDEFSLYFKQMSNKSEEALREACVLVEAVGPDFKKEIIKAAVDSVLVPYSEVFDRRENKALNSMDKRFAWFERALNEFRSKYGNIFPKHWAVPCYIVHEFCGITSVHVNEMLLSQPNSEEQIILLITALKKTISFETDMQKRLSEEFDQYLKSEIPKVKGAISRFFENHTQAYVDQEEKDLREAVQKELNLDLQKPEKFKESAEELNVLGSSFVLFTKVKQLLDRASKISRGHTMLQVVRCIKSIITKYLDLVRGQIGKEEAMLRKEEKTERRFLLNLSILLSTVDYIRDTLAKLSDLVLGLLDEPYNQNIDFSEEETYCQKVVLEVIASVGKCFEQRLDSMLSSTMLKVAWDRLETVKLASPYVTEVSGLLGFFADTLRDKVSNVFFVRSLRTLADALNLRFLESLYKIKKISPAAVDQLQLDFSELRKQLNVVSLNKKNEPMSAMYSSVVEQTCDRTKLLISALALPIEQLYDALKPVAGLSMNDLQRLLAVRGMKRSDITPIGEKLKLT